MGGAVAPVLIGIGLGAVVGAGLGGGAAEVAVIRPAFSGQFQTAIYAAALRSRYSLWTSCGVR